MKQSNLHIGMVASVVMVVAVTMSCSTPHRIEEFGKQDIMNIRQMLSKEKKHVADTASTPEFITYVDDKGVKQTVVKAEIDTATGDYITSLELGEVTVVAKSKTVPERNGVISLEFVVTVPGMYLQRDWKLVVKPILLNGDIRSSMDSLQITGTMYKEMYQRDRMAEQRKLKARMRSERMLNRRYPQDSLIAASNAYERFMTIHTDGIRLDTVITDNDTYEYFYSHDINTRNVGNRLKICFDAYVMDCVNDRYRMRDGDTLDFVISSMNTFLDRRTRYKRQTVYRKVTEGFSANIQFLVGDTHVLDTLGDNAMELQRIAQKMKDINDGNEFVFDSVVIVASCSPEGSVATNKILAEERAQALRKYLSRVIASNASAEELLVSRSKAEDWDRIVELIRRDTVLTEKRALIDIIQNEPDQDRREIIINRNFPFEYTYMRNKLYPLLRAVDFRFHLARRNMVEDVMFTDVVDTAYADAIALMDKRLYKEAMPKLLEYEDWNTAICYMTLGYNKTAQDILLKQPESSDREYLLAILAAREDNIADAVAYYRKACTMDPAKAMRGELDPEIASLIKKYDLNKDFDW